MINPAILIDTVIDNRYRLTRELGKGSYGWVFEATEEMAGQYVGRVAVKLLAPSDDFQREMVLREIRALAGLNHEHIIAYRTSGQVSEGTLAGSIFLVTELGEASLANAIPPGERLADEEIVAVAQGMALALSYLHAKGSVHRDMKPENIFRVDGKWKLGDFGLARAVEGAQMSGSGAKGTLRYMAPEALNNEITAATDVYALGVTLLRALTGSYAHEGEGEGQFIANLMTKPAELPPDLSSRWRTILTGCLERNVRDRWTAAHLGQQLGGGQAAYAVADAPPSRAPRTDATPPLRSRGSSLDDRTMSLGDRSKNKTSEQRREESTEEGVSVTWKRDEYPPPEPLATTTSRVSTPSQRSVKLRVAQGMDDATTGQDVNEDAMGEAAPAEFPLRHQWGRSSSRGGLYLALFGLLVLGFGAFAWHTGKIGGSVQPHRSEPTDAPTQQMPLPVMERRITSGRPVEVRKTPSHDALTLGLLTRDAIVRTVGRSGEWFQIQTPTGRAAWVHESAFEDTTSRSGQAEPTTARAVGDVYPADTETEDFRSGGADDQVERRQAARDELRRRVVNDPELRRRAALKRRARQAMGFRE